MQVGTNFVTVYGWELNFCFDDTSWDRRLRCWLYELRTEGPICQNYV